MTKVSASEAKTRFGALLDHAQLEPVTIEKQGRPVAVMVSFRTYSREMNSSPSDADKKHALRFLETWARLPPVDDALNALDGDPRAQAIWDKYARAK